MAFFFQAVSHTVLSRDSTKAINVTRNFSWCRWPKFATQHLQTSQKVQVQGKSYPCDGFCIFQYELEWFILVLLSSIDNNGPF